MSRFVGWGCWALWGVLVGCDPTTAVLLHVESELRAPEEVDEIRVIALAESGRASP